MDQALKDERLTLFLRHVDADEKICQIRSQQLSWHQRITEIDHAELRENINLTENTVMTPTGAVKLGK